MEKTRHAWSDPVRFAHKTERECEKCGLIKVTRHEIDGLGRTTHWIEWFMGLDKIESEKTPVCEMQSENAE